MARPRLKRSQMGVLDTPSRMRATCVFRIRWWVFAGDRRVRSAGHMVMVSAFQERDTELVGRRAECGVLDGLVEAIRAGASRSLVLCGEPGVGKTALLEYVAEHASGCRVVRAAGVQSEMELAFAGLHQLLAPLLDPLRRLAPPRRLAPRSARGGSPGRARG